MGLKPFLPRDPAITSAAMRRVRSSNTSPEMMLRRELHARGLRYRLQGKDLPGKPDLVFRSARVAVFVDGDFWHGHSWELGVAGPPVNGISIS
jgi:DNA mismatch endonuclease, patch repair protein